MDRLTDSEFRALLRPYAVFEPENVVLISEPPCAPDIALSNWRSEMTQHRLEAIESPGIYLDYGPTGIGKSTADLKVFQTGKRVLSVQPTHANCAEVVTQLTAAGIDAAAYPERISTGDRQNCQNREADEVERIGLPVQQTICFCCAHKNECQRSGFLGEFNRAVEADVAVATHARAARSGLEKLSEGREVISIHEDVLNVLITQTTVDVSQLEIAQRMLHRLLNEPKYLDRFSTVFVPSGSGDEREVDAAKTNLRNEQYEFLKHLADVSDVLVNFACDSYEPCEIQVPRPMELPNGIHNLLFRICREMRVHFGDQPVWQLLLATATGAFDREGVLVDDYTLLTDESNDVCPSDLFDSSQSSEES